MPNFAVMPANMKRFAGYAFAIALVGALPACVAAGAAALGAGSGIYFTTRGVGSNVKGSAADVERRARDVFAQEGIPITGTQTENGGEKREIKGNKNGLDISVSMEQQGGATKTEVTARKNLVEWDKDYAQQLLNKIVAAS
jgi:hypothetical protein